MPEQIELVHSAEYAAILKASQKFVSKNDMRSMVLKMVLHRKDGTMIACDGLRAIFFKDAHGFKEDLLINPFSYEIATGKYPDIEENLKPIDGIVVCLHKTQVDVWLQVHKSMNQMNKTFGRRANIGNLVMGESGVKLCIGEDDETKVSVELPISDRSSKDGKQILYNIEYMRDALQAHKDFGTTEMKLRFGTSLPDRIKRRRSILAAKGYATCFPLAEWEETLRSTRYLGIDPPETYDIWKHANCIGCLWAGQQHWYVVYCRRKDVWEKAKYAESVIGYSILRVNNKPTFLRELESKFEVMRRRGIPADEKTPSGRFWAQARRILGANPIEEEASCGA